MKKLISYSLFLGASLSCVTAFASDEVNLKKSCLKDYPEVVGESNPELIGIYAQLCDKKNKDSKNTFLLSAAQKFQQIGKNDKAIQIVNYLESQNVQSNELTDVKFLSGVGLAYDALNKMHKESRTLTEDKTYPVALNFTEAVKKATPDSIAKAAEAETKKAEAWRKAEANRKAEAARKAEKAEAWRKAEAHRKAEAARKAGEAKKTKAGGDSGSVTTKPPASSPGSTPFRGL